MLRLALVLLVWLWFALRGVWWVWYLVCLVAWAGGLVVISFVGLQPAHFWVSGDLVELGVSWLWFATFLVLGLTCLMMCWMMVFIFGLAGVVCML